MNQIELFETECREEIRRTNSDEMFMKNSRDWFEQSLKYKYSYHFTWMGIPIIQYPQDIMAMQELIFRVKPDMIVETGVAHGGSIVFYASMLQLLGGGKVVGVDVDIRSHNRERLESHPMRPYITLLEGSSTDDDIVRRVKSLSDGAKNTMIVLDSMHTGVPVLDELRIYSQFVRKGGYIVVCDTFVENMPVGFYPDRPWDVGNNPMTAVRAFLKENARFEIDDTFERKTIFTCAPNGFLRCIANN
jgi:cephalosporin hydroxylase